jgi:hypothetical protein
METMMSVENKVGHSLSQRFKTVERQKSLELTEKLSFQPL